MSKSTAMSVVQQQTQKQQMQKPEPHFELIPLPNLSHGGLVMHRGSGQYHLDNPNATFFSQYHQEDVIVRLLPGRPPPGGRFFVEVGGFDGERFSNSLYFERSLGWDGLLVEANPYAYEKLLSRGRRAYSVKACLGKAEHLSFLLAGDMTVAQEHRSDYHASKVRKMISSLRGDSNATASRADAEPGATVKATCTPLAALLAAVPGMASPARVDLMVLDVEGAELDVLQSLDWDALDIRMFMVEVLQHRDYISALLRSKGYVLAHSGQIDDFYVKKRRF